MFGLGPWEIAVILIVVVLVFGVGRLPELGTGLGEAIKNFKKSYREAKAIDMEQRDLETKDSLRAEKKGDNC